MNGIEKITARITGDADGEINQIREEAEASVREIQAAYAESAQEETEAILAKGRRAAAEQKERLDNMAQMEAKKMILAAKQEMLDEAFDRALTHLTELPDAEKIPLLAGLAANASVSGVEEVIFPAKDREAFGSEVVKEANRILSESGRNAGLVLSEKTAAIRGGLLLNDRDVEVNCAFETLVRLTRNETAGQVAKVLFD
jgi:V/A-type H+-transporting ATPase subunit E